MRHCWIRFLLLPGPLEPRAELLLRCLKNGVIPIAAYCDGLRQFIQDFDPVSGSGNGFVFYRETVEALIDAIRRVIKTPEDDLSTIINSARAVDFSWTAAARSHEKLYQRLLAGSHTSF